MAEEFVQPFADSCALSLVRELTQNYRVPLDLRNSDPPTTLWTTAPESVFPWARSFFTQASPTEWTSRRLDNRQLPTVSATDAAMH
jgi:hypothetical protein